MLTRRVRRNTTRADLFTNVVLHVFHVNGQLLAAGDRLVEDLGLTSARWQMLGAVALSQHPQTAPQLAAHMGMTRQAAQKQLDLLLDGGLVATEDNPGHARSPLYVLTTKGTSIYAATARVQTAWADRVAANLPLRDLKTTARVLEALGQQLNTK